MAGGRKPTGYVREFSPDHPNADKKGYVFQHRLVMECLIGRLLDREELVHHRNHVRHDNRAENLEVMGRPEHAREHGDETRERSLAPLTEDQVREALTGRTTGQAAALLDVNHQTLRNRFPELLSKRRSPGAPLGDELAALVRSVASDQTLSFQAACLSMDVSSVTLRKWCRMIGVEWASAPTGRPSRQASELGDRWTPPPSHRRR